MLRGVWSETTPGKRGEASSPRGHAPYLGLELPVGGGGRQAEEGRQPEPDPETQPPHGGSATWDAEGRRKIAEPPGGGLAGLPLHAPGWRARRACLLPGASRLLLRSLRGHLREELRPSWRQWPRGPQSPPSSRGGSPAPPQPRESRAALLQVQTLPGPPPSSRPPRELARRTKRSSSTVF